jgi:hypothetical protein
MKAATHTRLGSTFSVDASQPAITASDPYALSWVGDLA